MAMAAVIVPWTVLATHKWQRSALKITHHKPQVSKCWSNAWGLIHVHVQCHAMMALHCVYSDQEPMNRLRPSNAHGLHHILIVFCVYIGFQMHG